MQNMFSIDAYLTFLLACIALAIVPGPTVTVIIANSLRFGTKAGIGNVLGTQAGFVIWLVVAALGLGAAISVMGVYFEILRLLGAGYLVWIGIKMLRSKGDLAIATNRARPGGSFFWQGFVVIMSNPKMLVLFGAMIPPFIVPTGNAMVQTLLLGGSFMLIAFFGDSFYAITAGKAGDKLSRSRIHGLELFSGICLIGGGLWMVLRGR
jgi:homoserine/homoserine lactone efflux protein